MSAPLIVKADGTTQSFDRDRLANSLHRAGAGEQLADRISSQIEETLVPGTASKEVYARAFALLRKEGRPIAARYSLRRALLELGPSGHPFEDFISHLYIKEGWEVETRKIIRGKCVSHEVDFYASHKEKGEYMAAELKYHNDPGYKTDVKIALYVKSRFDDIFACDPNVRACTIDRGILVTNTKFTTDAIQYAQCAGVELLGWSFPEHDNLFIRMTRAKVYPVTTLVGLARAEKRMLVDSGTITVDQLLARPSALTMLHLSPEKVGEIMAEADALLELPAVRREYSLKG